MYIFFCHFCVFFVYFSYFIDVRAHPLRSDVIAQRAGRRPVSRIHHQKVREEEPAGCVQAEQDFRSVIPASQFLAGPARSRTGLADSRCDERLIFSSVGGRKDPTVPTEGYPPPPPQLTDTLPNPRWRRPLHLSLLAAAASFSKLGDQIRARVKTKTNPIPAHLVPLFEFWGVQPGSQSLGTNSPNYVASSLESWRCFHGAPASEAKAFCRAELQRGNCNVGPLLD